MKSKIGARISRCYVQLYEIARQLRLAKFELRGDLAIGVCIVC